MLENYMAMDHFVIRENAAPAEVSRILSQLKSYNLIIAGIHGMKLTHSSNFGLTDSQLAIIRKTRSPEEYCLLIWQSVCTWHFAGT